MHLPRSLCVELGPRDMLVAAVMVTHGGGWTVGKGRAAVEARIAALMREGLPSRDLRGVGRGPRRPCLATSTAL